MAQADYVVDNGSGAVVRAGINTQLEAIATNNSGATAPSVTYPRMWWPDETSGRLKQRNAANTAWIDRGALDSANFGHLDASNNLSDLASASTARTNLGLGTASTKNTGASDGDVVEVQTGGKLPALDGSLLTNLPSTGGNYFGTGADGAVTISTNTTLATTTGVNDTGYVVKNYDSLTINSGVTLSAATRAKLMLIYVRGDCTINGTLSMDAKGAAGSASAIAFERIVAQTLFAELQGLRTSITIPAAGASGGNGGTSGLASAGSAGSAGANGQTGGGGGGAGGSAGTNYGNGGAGAAGTAFVGGSGGGAGGYSGSATTGSSAAANGGQGGNAGANSTGASGGGAGNPVGAGAFGGSGSVTAPTGGGGGTIILIVGGNLTIGAGGIISANGSNGGNAAGGVGVLGGGGAGGGSIVVLYAGTLTNSGTIRANGGSGGTATGGSSANAAGGNGGAGSIQGPTKISA